jgi:hypothetical protein
MARTPMWAATDLLKDELYARVPKIDPMRLSHYLTLSRISSKTGSVTTCEQPHQATYAGVTWPGKPSEDRLRVRA